MNPSVRIPWVIWPAFVFQCVHNDKWLGLRASYWNCNLSWGWNTTTKKLANHRRLSLIQGVSQDPEEPKDHMWVPPASHPQPCRYSSLLLWFFSKSWNLLSSFTPLSFLSFSHRQISTRSRLHEAFKDISVKFQLSLCLESPRCVLVANLIVKTKGRFFCFKCEAWRN